MAAPAPSSPEFPLPSLYFVGDAADRPNLMQTGVNHILFVENPKSRRHNAADDAFEIVRYTAKRMGMVAERQHTSPHLHENAAMLHNNAGEQTALVTHTGDGALTELDNARAVAGLDIPILALPGGNANDFAHAMFTPWTLHNPEKLLETGRVRDFHPLQVFLEGADGARSHFRVLTYLSLGMSALGGARYNSSEYKDSPWHRHPGGTFIKEKLVAGETFLQAASFMMRATVSEQLPQDDDLAYLPGIPHYVPVDFRSRQHSTMEFLVANIPHMAKILRPRVKTFEPEVRVIHAADKAEAAEVTGSLMAGIPVGTTVAEGQVIHFEAKGKEIYLQNGGEDLVFKDGVRGTISFGAPTSVVSTRRAA